MISPKRVRSGLQNCFELLSDAGEVLTWNPVVEEKTSAGRTRVTWRGRNRKLGFLFRSDSTLISSYLSWIAEQAYSAVFSDGSLVQISYEFMHNDVVGHRLVYWPCPFCVDADILREEPLLDIFLDAHCRGNQRLVSAMRFDFDMTGENDDHPASHLSLNSDECRIPVSSPLTPRSFFGFVFRHFYPRSWRVLEFLDAVTTFTVPRVLTAAYEQEVHMLIGRP